MQTLDRTTTTELVTDKPILTEAAADLVARAAEAEAIARGVAPVIAVVDDGGMLITLRRPDAAQVASVDVAMDKARTAAIFRRPSKDFEDQTRNGRVAALALHGAVSLQGGMPIVYQDRVIGAIGVSGASSADEDQELAVIGANAAAMFDHMAMPDVFHADAETVTRKFITGGLLLDTDMYKVDAGRRVAAGEVELHTYVTDVMYVLEGEATVVTGGEVLDHRQVGPGEYRGSALVGGAAQLLRKGDVMVVPQGIPHWFQSVSGPLQYYVVKVVQAH
jgi:glc operon protein GlcG